MRPLMPCLVALAAWGCGTATQGPIPATAHADTARPADCTLVAPGTLGAALEAAAEDTTLCLAPGKHPGPVNVTKRVSITGPREARITGGNGSTITIEAPGARLEGFTVDGSGMRIDTLDAAIRVRASDVTLEHLRIENAFFGITSEKTARVTIRGCDIDGGGGEPIGQRGDAIRLWETNDSLVEGNTITGGRDLVVWYSLRNTLRGNRVTNDRYGTHFMFSHENVVEGNTYLGNTVGIFVMYSRRLAIRDNVLAGSTGAAGIGLGLKESGALRVSGNTLAHDTTGIYVDTSPLQDDDFNVFEGNSLRFTQSALTFHGSESRNTFTGNTLADNRAQVTVEGGADALGVEFRGNDFDDYQGYDLDGDGTGDLPYEVRSLSSDVLSRHPDVAFLAGTPALAMVELVGRALPLFAPKLLMRDPAPRVGPRPGGG